MGKLRRCGTCKLLAPRLYSMAFASGTERVPVDVCAKCRAEAKWATQEAGSEQARIDRKTTLREKWEHFKLWLRAKLGKS